MIDNHIYPENWGILPSVFKLGWFEISSYSFFVTLGLIVGLLVYYFLAKRYRMASERSFYVVVAAVTGGVLGAKLPYWVFNFNQIVANYPNIAPILSGRTITGGLIGGTLAVIYIKRRLGIHDKKGNLFAPAIAIGLAIGRLGCFFRGCCYGEPTTFFCGVDFGDAILRHPTQLYETAFFVFFFIYSLFVIRKAPPGHLFYQLMNSYFILRFFEEFIRYNERLFFGLSFFQYISLLAIAFINIKFYLEKSGKYGRLISTERK